MFLVVCRSVFMLQFFCELNSLGIHFNFAQILIILTETGLSFVEIANWMNLGRKSNRTL